MTPVCNAQQAIPILCTAACSARMCLVWLKIRHGVNDVNVKQKCKYVLSGNGSSCTDGKIFASASLQLLLQNLLLDAIHRTTYI